MAGDGQLEFPIPYGKYELLERIGDGGMAEVFRARLPGVAGFEKTVVIKRMLPHLSRKPNFVEMFVGEAKLAAQVQHRNVVQVFELSQHDSGEYFIVMEYVEGTDLRRILKFAARRQLRLPPWFSVHVITEVLDALSFAHGLADEAGVHRNIVHRDVTPSNLFISKVGGTKLGDFGVAHDTTRASQTKAGQLKGKVAYMAPEQLYSRAVDARTDLFAVGVVLWECLTQRRLFGGGPDIEIMNKIVNAPRRPATRYANDIPTELDHLVARALSVDPGDRFQSAREMQDALLDIAPQLGPTPRPEMMRSVVEVMMGRADPSSAGIGVLENKRKVSASESSPSIAQSRGGSTTGHRFFGNTATSSPEPLDDPLYHKNRGDSSPRPNAARQAVGGGYVDMDVGPPATPIPEVKRSTTDDIQRALAQPVSAQPVKTPTPVVPPATPPPVLAPKRNALLDHFRAMSGTPQPPPPPQAPSNLVVSPPVVPPPPTPPELPSNLIVPAAVSPEPTSPLELRSNPIVPAANPPAKTSPVEARANPIAPATLPPARAETPRPRTVSTARATTGAGGVPLGSSTAFHDELPPPRADSTTPRPTAWSTSPSVSDTRDLRGMPPSTADEAMAELRAFTEEMPPLEDAPPRLPPSPSSPPTPPTVMGQPVDEIDALVAKAVDEVREMPEAKLELVPQDSVVPGLEHSRHATRVSDQATQKWASFGLGDGPYKGKHPFWLRDNDGERIGPCDYEQAIGIVRSELRARLSETSEISANGTDWMTLRDFAELVGMESMLRHDDEIVPERGLIVGSLEKRSLAAVFGVLARNEATGRLFVVDSAYNKTDFREVEVISGRPTHVYANEDKLQLPDLLVSKNIVPGPLMSQLVHDALSQKKTLTSQTSAYLASDIARYRAMFMKERLIDLFARATGRFTFQKVDEPPHKRPFAKSLIGLLPELVHRAMESEQLLRKLSKVSGSELKPCESFARRLDEMNLTRAQLGAAWMLGQGRRIDDLVRQWPEDKRLYLTMAYVLVETELLRPN